MPSTKADSSKLEEVEEKIRAVSNLIFKLRKEINDAWWAVQSNY